MPSNTESTDALAIAREQITKEIKEDLRTGSGEWYNVFSSSSAEPSVLEQMAAIRTADNYLLGGMTAKAIATLDQGEDKLEVSAVGCMWGCGVVVVGWGVRGGGGWNSQQLFANPVLPVCAANVCGASYCCSGDVFEGAEGGDQ